MNREFYGPAWADGHARLSDAIGRTFAAVARTIGTPFERLLAYQYAAPWRQVQRPASD